MFKKVLQNSISKKLLLSIYILANFVNNSDGQELPFSRVEASVNYGYLAPHSNDMLHLYRGHFQMFKLSFSNKTDGSRYWHKPYGFPHTGVDLSYVDLAYPEVLGKAFSIIPHIKFSYGQSSYYRFSIRPGLGLAYLTKKYDMLENYKNTAISTNLNLALNVSFDNEFIIKNQYHVIAGLGLTHFSNGRMGTPNKGINIPVVKLGLSFGQPESTNVRHENVFDKQRTTEVLLVASGGTAADYPIGSPKNYRAVISGLISQPINSRHRIGLGYDMFYYHNNNDVMAHLAEVDFIPYLFNHGILLAFQLDFGKTAFIVQKGAYIYDKHDYQPSLFYHRLGFRQVIYNDLLFNLTLKTHFFKAQFIEIGIGYRIFQK